MGGQPGLPERESSLVPPSKQSLESAPAAVLQELKRLGPCDASALAEALEVTPTAVRQHLYLLQERGVVTHQLEPRPMGRPAKLWKATSEANVYFADAHGQLLSDLLESSVRAVGAEGLDRIVQCYAEDKRRSYLRRTSRTQPLRDRLVRLVELRSEEGFMAQCWPQEDGSYLFVESHCPISQAAQQCQQFCDQELALFREVLGDDVQVTREEHMVDSGDRCTYRICRASQGALPAD